jgi:predicted NAD-dependent protein-ADP-ribosyltransferase YbiA (DUF1768 family)
MKITLLVLSLYSALASAYPAEWWTPVDKGSAPSWEVLPQDAGPGEVILSKRNELGILSNFADTPFVLDGQHFASVEGLWQAMKYPEGPNDERLKDPHIKWPYTRAQVAAMTAFDAKKAGSIANENMKALRIDWVTYQGRKMRYLENAKGAFYQVIWHAENEKLKQNPDVRKVLAKTGNLKLRPDHVQSPSSAPAWKYYEIWMEIRAGL